VTRKRSLVNPQFLAATMAHLGISFSVSRLFRPQREHYTRTGSDPAIEGALKNLNPARYTVSQGSALPVSSSRYPLILPVRLSIVDTSQSYHTFLLLSLYYIVHITVYTTRINHEEQRDEAAEEHGGSDSRQ